MLVIVRSSFAHRSLKVRSRFVYGRGEKAGTSGTSETGGTGGTGGRNEKAGKNGKNGADW